MFEDVIGCIAFSMYEKNSRCQKNRRMLTLQVSLFLNV